MKRDSIPGSGSAELVHECKMLLCPQAASLQASNGSERGWGVMRLLKVLSVTWWKRAEEVCSGGG